mgnify:CR=1 FL=1
MSQLTAPIIPKVYQGIPTCKQCHHYLTDAQPSSVCWEQRYCLGCTGIARRVDGIKDSQLRHDTEAVEAGYMSLADFRGLSPDHAEMATHYLEVDR